MEQTLPFCPVETTLTLVGDKWKVIILKDSMEGTKRFGELKNHETGYSLKPVLDVMSVWGVDYRRLLRIQKQSLA